jgi:hypothetical protein
MRNFLPIGLFAAAASLTIFGTPSFHASSLSADESYRRTPEAAEHTSVQLEEDGRIGDHNDMRFFVPRCDRESHCAVRRPMT